MLNSLATNPDLSGKARSAAATHSGRSSQPGASWRTPCRRLAGALLLAILSNVIPLWRASGGGDPASAAAAFVGEVRYHFREKLSGDVPGEPRMSAPATEIERLTLTRRPEPAGLTVPGH
jgi:hypothetical protein